MFISYISNIPLAQNSDSTLFFILCSIENPHKIDDFLLYKIEKNSFILGCFIIIKLNFYYFDTRFDELKQRFSSSTVSILTVH
jgi:hypothetical protein